MGDKTVHISEKVLNAIKKIAKKEKVAIKVVANRLLKEALKK